MTNPISMNHFRITIHHCYFSVVDGCNDFVGNYGVLSHDDDHNDGNHSTSHTEKGGRGSRPGSAVNHSRRSSTRGSPGEERTRKHSGTHDTLRYTAWYSLHISHTVVSTHILSNTLLCAIYPFDVVDT